MYEEESVDLQPNFIPALLKYKWYLITIIPLLLIATLSVVVLIPPIYRSDGTVVVETQQIPESLVKSTVTSIASERIAIIQQRVMTREKLMGIINKYDYFKPEDDSELAMMRVLNHVRNNIYVDVVEAQTGSRRKPINTIAFSVGFDARNPFIAQAVANELMTLFLNENIKVRTERATETTEFLKAEAEKLKVELEKTESQVAKFKQENKDALPEHLNLYMSKRERAESQLSDIKRTIQSLEEQSKLIDSQMNLVDGNVSRPGTNSSLIAMQQQYERLLLTLTPEHPDVIALRRQIESLANAGSSVSNESTGVQSLSSASIELKKQLVDLGARLKSYRMEKQALEEEIEDLENRIMKIPQVERALTGLVRENQSLSRQYNDLLTKSLEASIAESLEEGLKAERFSILESAMQPIAPYRPDRKKLALAAFAFSVGGPLGLVLLLGFLDKNIYGYGNLNKLVGGVAVLNVDYVPSTGEVEKRKIFIITGALLALFISMSVLACIHIFVIPLDVLIYNIILRFSGG